MSCARTAASVTVRPLSIYRVREHPAGKGSLPDYGAVREDEIGTAFTRLAKVSRG